MRVIYDVNEMSLISNQLRKSNKTIGFVPTMGYFHEGHLSLMKQAKLKNNVLVTSIFVNPKQFGPNEDFDKYPRDIERDKKLAYEVGVNYLFYPDVKQMYPDGYQTYVYVKNLSKIMCGKYRPTHFEGVTTVVLKLFNIVKPHQAFFGQKDYQQAVIIKRMVKDLNLDIDIVVLPIVREKDGLAMSSRNTYLKPEERKIAPNIYKSLLEAEKLVKEKKIIDSHKIIKKALDYLSKFPQIKVQYLELRDAETLEPIEKLTKKAVLAIAAFIGDVRLIDNILISPPE